MPRSRSALPRRFTSPAPSAGSAPSPSAPPDTAGSVSTQTPHSPTHPSSDSASPTDTPATPAAPAPEAATDAKGEDSETCIELIHTPAEPVQLTDAGPNRQRDLDILDALSHGTPYREISQRFRVSITTLSTIAKRQAELESGAIANLMKTETLTMLDAWKDAALAGVAAGKHAAAKEWLTHSRVLAPILSDGGNQGAKVAIIIGQPGQPVDPLSLQVIDIQEDSSD